MVICVGRLEAVEIDPMFLDCFEPVISSPATVLISSVFKYIIQGDSAVPVFGSLPISPMPNCLRLISFWDFHHLGSSNHSLLHALCMYMTMEGASMPLLVLLMS